MTLKDRSLAKRHQPRPIVQERPDCPERFSLWCLRLAVRAVQRDRVEERLQQAKRSPQPANKSWQWQVERSQRRLGH